MTRILPLILIGLACTTTRAATEPADPDLAQLESLLRAQQQRLAALHHQLVAQESVDVQRATHLRDQIREVLSESDFRESLTTSAVTAGYERGFFIRSADDKFKLKVNGRLQFRWTWYHTRSANRYMAPGFRRHDRAGFDMPRIYFAFGGHAYSPDLTYALILDASEYRAYDTGVLHAWVNYRLRDEFQIRAGIMRVAGTRANVNTATMQMVETPLFDAVFALPRGLGVRFWGKLFEGQPVHGQYRLDIVNSFGTPVTRTITNDEELYRAGHDNNPAIFFRTVWCLLGGGCCEYKTDAVPFPFASCDLAYHTSPHLNIGFHYGFSEDDHDGTVRLPYPRRSFFRPGGFALTSSAGLGFHQFGLDAGFKYRGFSATFEYGLRLFDVRNADHPPFTPLFLATGDDSTNAQQGGYLQCGYFLPIPGWERKFEVTARVEAISAQGGGREGTWAYAGGFNYYIDGHRVKLQTDVTKVSEVPISNSTVSLANVNDDALIWRMQLQVAF